MNVNHAFIGIAANAWHTVHIALDASRKPSHARLDVDGTNRLDVDLTFDFTQISSLQIRMGLAYATPGTQYSAHVDDVHLDVR